MGERMNPAYYANDGTGLNPDAGEGLDALRLNQVFLGEIEGAQTPISCTIADGSISPTAAYVIVDTEGGAAADDLTAISNVLSASENLHDGMVIYLKAADSGRVVTVKSSSSANGINTYDGNDYVLSPTHWLKLQLRSGKWYEIEGRAMETALAAATAAASAATAADHATTKSGTSSTASGTAAKVVACSGFELSDQTRVVVTFSNANTVADALTLNINGTGAKAVYNQTGIISATNTALFAANQPIEFRYDGTGWVFYDVTKAVSSGTFLASSSTAAGTSAKVADCPGFSLSNPARVLVTFTNANTVFGALTLNVNSTGAKSIYNELGAVSATNPATFPAGVPIEFIYDGAHWTYRKYQDEFAKTVGGAPMYTCRAWVNFTVPSGVPAIQGSGNVSSITDRGVGLFTANLTIPLPDANAAVDMNMKRTENYLGLIGLDAANTQTASAIFIRCTGTDGMANLDPALVCVTAHR